MDLSTSWDNEDVSMLGFLNVCLNILGFLLRFTYYLSPLTKAVIWVLDAKKILIGLDFSFDSTK